MRVRVREAMTAPDERKHRHLLNLSTSNVWQVKDRLKFVMYEEALENKNLAIHTDFGAPSSGSNIFGSFEFR